MTAPRNSKVAYVVLPEGGPVANQSAPITLIDHGLQHPQGIAVDQKHKRLFVADPDAQKIYSYQLVVGDGGSSLSVEGDPVVVSQGAESRWVAVDGAGNLFFSDEPQNLILQLQLPDRGSQETHQPTAIYNATMNPEVSQPGGVAVDNFNVFWTNKHFGLESGSVIKGAEHGGSSSRPVTALAKNTPKSYGVCLALDNVYFTDSESYIWGVKKSGGMVEEISSQLTNPRGCAWDGDGTVYVADRAANAIFSFAGNMHVLARADLMRTYEFEDAFGLAVLQAVPSCACKRHSLVFVLFLASVLVTSLHPGVGIKPLA